MDLLPPPLHPASLAHMPWALFHCFLISTFALCCVSRRKAKELLHLFLVYLCQWLSSPVPLDGGPAGEISGCLQRALRFGVETPADQQERFRVGFGQQLRGAAPVVPSRNAPACLPGELRLITFSALSQAVIKYTSVQLSAGFLWPSVVTQHCNVTA